jgi:hypothetical protein
MPTLAIAYNHGGGFLACFSSIFLAKSIACLF